MYNRAGADLSSLHELAASDGNPFGVDINNKIARQQNLSNGESEAARLVGPAKPRLVFGNISNVSNLVDAHRRREKDRGITAAELRTPPLPPR